MKRYKLILFVIIILFVCNVALGALPDNPYMTLYRQTAKINAIKLYSDITELEEKLAQARTREQSDANKLLGAAAIGLTGIGGMQLMGGMAEQRADADAARDMQAYLATFVCDYGAGRNIKGGDVNIELPGGNGLMAVVAEYRALALDLKTRKEALGLAPGIESDVIYDAADTGLYDNASVGRQGGAYMSLSRALSDENSTDAAEWSAQKSSGQSKTKNGAIVGGVGAVGGLIGNMVESANYNKQDN